MNQYVNVRGEGRDAHWRVAKQVAAEAVTLVKNEEKVLPLKRDGGAKGGEVFRVGIFGEDAGPGKGANACQDRGCNEGT